MNKIVLKKGRDESLKRFHPWVFSGAVDKVEGQPVEGEVVEVVDSQGNFIAYGHCQVGTIVVRVLSFDQEYLPEDGEDGSYFEQDFWVDRLSRAINMRSALNIASEQTTAYRLVHGEGDSLPGLIVDLYGKVAVMQAHSAGMFLARKEIAKALRTCLGDKLDAVYDKSEGTAPFKAELELSDGYILGDATGENVVLENGKKFRVNWEKGQKTGFFLDQRDNRSLVETYSSGKKVLNLFCYTGGFSIYALAGGAKKVVSVDSSRVAIEMLEKNVAENGYDLNAEVEHKSICGDAMEYMNNLEKDEFDLIIVDPPAFAKHRGSLKNALRAYTKLNANAIEKVAKGGIVFTYSCSQVVDSKSFALAVFSAAARVGRKVKILHRLTQPADHPVNIYHPEGEYLKGLVLYVE